MRRKNKINEPFIYHPNNTTVFKKIISQIYRYINKNISKDIKNFIKLHEKG